MILAEGAAQIAAVAADREDHAARIKCRQRLLLDRVERKRRHAAVVRADDLTVPAGPRPAEAERTFFYMTMSETCITCDHNYTCSCASCMPHDLEPIEHIILARQDPALVHGDRDLLIDRVHSV